LAAAARITAIFLAGALAAGPSAWAAAKPQRIMSMNLCTDLLLVQLVDRSRIASVTYLAADSAEAIAPGLARGLRINHGSAEEILDQKPDLILAGAFSTAATKAIARRAGAHLVETPTVVTFDDIRNGIRQVGAAVGEPVRAQALVTRLDQSLARLDRRRPARPYPVAAWTGDSAPGRQTLANTIIERAGAVNIAAKTDGPAYSTFGLEELLVLRPRLLLYSGEASGKPSLMADRLHHPAIRKIYEERQLVFPEPFYSCGLPQSAEAAEILADALARSGPAP